MNPISQKTMEQLYKDTMRKVKYLKDHGFEVEQKWGCELAKEMVEDEELKQFFEEYEIIDPLQPRDASITILKMLRVTSLLPFFTGMLILQVYTRGAIKIRTMSLAILKLSLRILQTFLPTLD